MFGDRFSGLTEKFQGHNGKFDFNMLSAWFLRWAKEQAREILAFDGDEEESEPIPRKIMDRLVSHYRFGTLLPYSQYDAPARIFKTDEGVGFILESAPITGADIETARMLAGLYMSCPAKTGVQISMFGDNNLLSLHKRFGNLAPEDEDNKTIPLGERKQRNKNVYRVIARRRIDAYLKAGQNKLHPDHNIIFLNYRVIISIHLPGNPEDISLLEKAVTIRDSVQQILKPAGLITRVWSADDLIDFLFTLHNPQWMYASRPRDFIREYEPGREVRHQVVSRETRTKVRESSLQFSSANLPEIEARTLSVTTYPRDYRLWHCGALIGDDFYSSLRYPCPFLLTLGVYILDAQATKARATVESARATQNAESKMAKFTPDLHEKKEDWDAVMRRLDEGHGMVKLYHQLIIFSPRDRIVQNEVTVRQIWRARGFTLESDEFMQAQAWLSALPLTLGPGLLSDLEKAERITTKTSANAIHTMPIIGEWNGGCSNPVLQFFSRKGQPVWLDFYANKSGNYNFAVSGVPGAGKSFVMNEIAIRYASAGALVRIIDIGRSYEKLCHQLGGEYIEFTRKNKLCFNPFTWVVDSSDPDADEGINEAIKMIKPTIAKMIEPRGTLSTYQLGALEKAIFTVWYEKKNESEVTDVANYLASVKDAQGNDDKVVQDMAVQMYSFTRDGQYGVYFSGPATINFKNEFTVLELEELKSTPDLRTVVMFVVMYKITHEMYMFRHKKKLCLTDESWQLFGDGEDGGEFIEEGYRRARKYNGLFGSGTQGIGDYAKTSAGRAAYNFADFKLYLRQDASQVEMLSEGENKFLILSPAEKRGLLSLQKEDGVFSEILIKSPLGSGIVRHIPDPFTAKLCSSKADDFEAINKLREDGYTVADAIDMLIAHEERLKGRNNYTRQ